MNAQKNYTEPIVAAIGVFDGVHLGHQQLLAAATRSAAKRQAQAVAITFDRDPDELFCPQQVHKLLPNEERLAALKTVADGVLALPFTRELAAMPWRAFLDHLHSLVSGLVAVHVGENFRFGQQAGGGIAELTQWAAPRGITVTAHPLFVREGKPVSATRIRALLAEGRVREASELLERPYALRGEVISGAGRGSGLGFATANIAVDGSYADLGPFVYAAYVLLEEPCAAGADVAGAADPAAKCASATRYKAAVSIGKPPTYAPEKGAFDPLFLEAHLLDFDGDLYGSHLRLEFIENLRPMRKFASEQDLIETVQNNINWVRQNL